MKNLDAKVNRLLAQAKERAAARRQDALRNRCKGADMEALVDLVCLAVAPEDDSIAEAVLDQVVEYSNWPKTTRGSDTRHARGVLLWLWGLQDGWAVLPERLPRPVLEAWRDGYLDENRDLKAGTAPDRDIATPVPLNRCGHCLMAYPNTYPSGGRSLLDDPCLVCGAKKWEHMNLWSGGWGTFTAYHV
jgi:hypothetical protein